MIERRLFNTYIATAAGVAASLSASFAGDDPKTADLDFMIGEWIVERTQRPGTENEQRLIGGLECRRAVSDQFIRCEYRIPREDRAPIHDVVFYNYNGIYDAYEGVWLSATWPIKNTMSAKSGQDWSAMIWTSEFLIEDGVTEYVRSTWRISDADGFSRRTEIRTSRDASGEWLHWMNETVRRNEDG